MNLLLATRNPHKTAELQAMLGPDWRLTDLSSLPGLPEVEETGTSFEENAILKAVAISRHLPETLVLADDSGLEVDALGGAPGVRSARYAGAHGNDHANNQKLLADMAGQENRRARFRCLIALARDGELLGTFPGAVEGTLLRQPQGRGGFGYDPLFAPRGHGGKTFAQLDPEVKNTLSHRRRALEAALPALLEE